MTDQQLNALLERARQADANGQVRSAREALLVVTGAMLERDRVPQDLYHWLARLESALGNHDLADEAATVGRAIAVEAARDDGVFRMDVLRADLARAALDLDRAEDLLAKLKAGARVLGPATVARRDEIGQWLRDLQFARARQPMAVMRAEATLAIAQVWAARGRYRSALALIDSFSDDVAATATVQRGEVRLLAAELAISAGLFEDGRDRLATLAGEGPPLQQARVAVVTARLALTTGRLAEALTTIPLLRNVPPTIPGLFAAAIAALAAVHCELNLFELAATLAAQARTQLAGAPKDVISIVERAMNDALARSRSAMKLWELPYVVATPTVAPQPTFEPVAAEARFTARWTRAHNQVISLLDVNDVVGAQRAQTELEDITRGVESEYIQCRVATSAALVQYFRGDSSMTAFLARAERLRLLGARLAEAQALRFAAWAAARRRNHLGYAELSRRYAEIVDDVASELEPTRRSEFLMNKWSGRDELVTVRIGEVLRGAEKRPLGRRVLCQLFREIDELTHWPIVDALADTSLARDADKDVVARWVNDRLASHSDRRGGVQATSLWHLWWFPARTLVLHYHVLPDRTYLFLIARRRIELAILPIGRVHLTGSMSELAEDEDGLAWLAEHTGVAAALRRYPGIRRLVIVPHDAIAGVPFAALRIEGRRLCELVPIAYVDRLSRLRKRPKLPPPGTLVSIGRRDYAGSSMGSLACAEQEASAVAVVGGGEAHLGATRTGVLAELLKAGRVHVAAHGVFDATDPGESGIVLGGNNGGFETLTLRELRALSLQRLRLATLATCRSAEHARLPGRERICLPTALLDAGVSGVIASLWPVEDEPSIRVMTSLYAHLRELPAAAALAATQAQLARNAPARQWAGLTFYGND